MPAAHGASLANRLGLKLAPMVAPSSAIMPPRRRFGTATRRPHSAAVPVAVMAPSRKASGSWKNQNTAAPAAPISRAKASARASADTAAEPHGGLAALQPPGGHDQVAVVVGAQHGPPALAADRRARP